MGIVFIIRAMVLVLVTMIVGPSLFAANRLDTSTNQLDVSVEPEIAISIPPKIVVLDPGHGGKDIGLQEDKKISEKMFTFYLASATKQLLDQDERIKTYLTRGRDKTISILERTIQGNRKKADLFISIHVMGPNGRSHFKKNVVVYVNQYVENIELTNLAEENLNQGIRVIPWDLAQNGLLAKSRHLAAQVVDTFGLQGLSYQQVLASPLGVLKGNHAAAVLIEFDHAITTIDEGDGPTQFNQYSSQLASAIKRFLY